MYLCYFKLKDVKLREAVALHQGQRIGGGVNWVKVSYHMGETRSSKQCRQRWYDTLENSDSGLRKEGGWTEDEVIS